jgi:ketosteroid isomerase-like protein
MGDAEVVVAFLAVINTHNADGVASMLSDDHEFIDSLGHALVGRDAVRAAWQGYFAFCPDYRVEADDVIADGNCVAAFGAAGGTISDGAALPVANAWRIPAAWRAVVKDGLVKRWQVYADNKPVYDILARRAVL